ncbi:hypothetical protein [Paenibacillus glacialis]|uniref:hypothetical protein n=1 Tax=Paenibacillus glacialis TaxID=494026 RepID=UPI000AAD72A0|nr:hypothetical protein [Paenibacillus glacialis]
MTIWLYLHIESKTCTVGCIPDINDEEAIVKEAKSTISAMDDFQDNIEIIGMMKVQN